MEYPVQEIAGVISDLTQGSPEQQEDAISQYFLPNASFSHPSGQVPSCQKGSVPLASGIESLWIVLSIYRWYRTISPHLDIKVDCAVFDQRTGLLSVSLRQTFALGFVPLYKAPMRLVSVLQLTQRTPSTADDTFATESPHYIQPKYYIASQEDLYPVADCVEVLVPGLGPFLWFMWELYTTWLCVMGSLLFLPMLVLVNGLLNDRPRKW
ncbi:hypothetical protein AK830_g11229 [Neonectria ditissima]|uniref:SigF-like NTF2-like domain-containing protein n=1 Tax=Neonectria ditissima TaxID=78410 RepID=A0A0P7B423_9HYPO|nr:hypothetical protein AK830_g11229 [Neonectria ditissima]